MPTSKVCGQCAICRKEFNQGDEAVFFGRVHVTRDHLEPGAVKCLHIPKVSMTVSHLSTKERCAMCTECWTNIKTIFVKQDIDEMGCVKECIGGS